MFKKKKNKWQLRYKELNKVCVNFCYRYDVDSLEEFERMFDPHMVQRLIREKNDIENEIARLNAALDHLKRAKEHILEL